MVDEDARAELSMSDKHEPSSNPGQHTTGLDHYTRLGKPLLFDPASPDSFLKEVQWRYHNRLRNPTGPVPITRLLNASEIENVKQIETATDAIQRMLRELWEKKEREDRAKGGRHGKRRLGIEGLVGSLLSRVGRRDLKPMALWAGLERFTSSEPREVKGTDGVVYQVYRDGDQLVQERDHDGQLKAIRYDTFRKRYVAPARQAIQTRGRPGIDG